MTTNKYVDAVHGIVCTALWFSMRRVTFQLSDFKLKTKHDKVLRPQENSISQFEKKTKHTALC